MTDELDQTAIGEPELGETPGEETSGFASADSSIAAGIPSLDDINLKNAKKAAGWVWDHTLGHDDDDKPVEPEPAAPILDIPSEEEVTMSYTWVEHDDPPPPPPEPEKGKGR